MHTLPATVEMLQYDDVLAAEARELTGSQTLSAHDSKSLI